MPTRLQRHHDFHRQLARQHELANQFAPTPSVPMPDPAPDWIERGRLWLRGYVTASVARARSGLGWEPAVRVALTAGEAAALGGVDELAARLTKFLNPLSQETTSVAHHHVDEDKLLDDLAAHAIADHRAKAHGVQATPFLDRLREVMTWLRANGVTFWALVAKIPSIISLLTAGGTWIEVIQALIALFGLSPSLAASAPPA